MGPQELGLNSDPAEVTAFVLSDTRLLLAFHAATNIPSGTSFQKAFVVTLPNGYNGNSNTPVGAKAFDSPASGYATTWQVGPSWTGGSSFTGTLLISKGVPGTWPTQVYITIVIDLPPGGVPPKP